MVTRIGSRGPVRHFLKQWRVYKGLTQQQLADRLPAGRDGKLTGKDQVSRWERSQRGMTMEVQVALADALGIAPGSLFHDPEEPSVDELLRSAPRDLRRQAWSLVEVLIKTRTGTGN